MFTLPSKCHFGNLKLIQIKKPAGVPPQMSAHLIHKSVYLLDEDRMGNLDLAEASPFPPFYPHNSPVSKAGMSLRRGSNKPGWQPQLCDGSFLCKEKDRAFIT